MGDEAVVKPILHVLRFSMSSIIAAVLAIFAWVNPTAQAIVQVLAIAVAVMVIAEYYIRHKERKGL